MKQDYKHYLPLTEEEMDEVWENCYIVPDTNILLGLYVYSEELREATFDILYKLKENGKLWIPHQVKIEFARNRLAKMKEPIINLEKLKNQIDNSLLEFEKIKFGKDFLGRKSHSPYLNLVKINKEIDKLKKTFINEVKSINKELEDKLGKINEPKFFEDKILERITPVFDEFEEKGFDDDKLEQIKNEAQKRYTNKVPPGYKDCKKEQDNGYGDYFIWKQMINKVKNENKDAEKRNIIFITGDLKEDWWFQHEGYSLLARPELRKEFFIETGKEFLVYKFDKFISETQKRFNFKIRNTKEIVKEAMELKENQDLPVIGIKDSANNLSFNRYFRSRDGRILSTIREMKDDREAVKKDVLRLLLREEINQEDKIEILIDFYEKMKNHVLTVGLDGKCDEYSIKQIFDFIPSDKIELFEMDELIEIVNKMIEWKFIGACPF